MTYETLINYLYYDALYGKFYWKKNYFKNKIGKEAGGINNGYIRIVIKRVSYSAHILAILWYKKEINKNLIVHHKDENRSNNILYNLEEVSHSEHNSIHFKKGDDMHYIIEKGNKWHVRVNINSTRKFIGSYTWLRDAKEARDKVLNL